MGRVENGKSETRRDAKTGILKSELETKKCSDLIDPGPISRLCEIPRLLVFQRTIHHPSWRNTVQYLQEYSQLHNVFLRKPKNWIH